MRALVLLSAVVVAVTTAVSVNVQPPGLPYNAFQSWLVITVNDNLANGTSVERSSVGMHVVVNTKEQMLCQHGILNLFPVTHEYTEIIVSNYSGHKRHSRVTHDSGSTTNCTSEKLEGSMPYGGAEFLAPPPSIFTQMKFSTYTPCNGFNCSVWQWIGDGANGHKHLMQWFLRVEDNVPQVLVNQSFGRDPVSGNITSHITTTAYNGYEVLNGGFPVACTQKNFCGEEVCIANAAVGTTAINSALTWVCGVESCGSIGAGGSKYYPNSAVAHGTVAFNEYYQANKDTGSGSCNFNGAAMLVSCNTACTTCNVSATSTLQDLETALHWVCGPDGIQDCSPIQRGGAHYMPNTTVAHANWAFNVYYQAYKCIPKFGACNFNGVGTIVDC